MADEDKTVETTGSKPQEDWMARRWRPMMGWTYMTTCLFDFVLAPVGWAILQAKLGQPVTQWMPLTLQGAGLYHMAMGAVLGVAAYGRTQEKLGGANNGGIQSTQPAAFGSTPSTGVSSPSPASPAPAATGFTSSAGFGSSASASPAAVSAPAEVSTGFGGKKAPPQPAFPEL